MDERRTVASGYDRVAQAYLDQRDAAGRAQAAALAEDVGGRVLDAGCGAGEPITAALAARCESVVGLDVSAGQLALLREHVPGATRVRGDLTALPFADAAFDGLVSAYAVIHVPQAATPGVLAEFHRVLRPGGQLLVTMGAEAWAGRNPDWLDAGAAMVWSFGDRDESLAMLTAAGFAVDEDAVIDDALDSAFMFVRATAE